MSRADTIVQSTPRGGRTLRQVKPNHANYCYPTSSRGARRGFRNSRDTKAEANGEARRVSNDDARKVLEVGANPARPPSTLLAVFIPQVRKSGKVHPNRVSDTAGATGGREGSLACCKILGVDALLHCPMLGQMSGWIRTCTLGTVYH